MRKYAAIFAAILAIAVASVPLTSHAGRPNQMEAEPNTGPEGTDFDVHNVEGSPCLNGEITVSVSGGPEGSPFNGVSGSDNTFKEKGGDWNVPLTVPEGSTPGEYTIDATCQEGQVKLQGGSFSYQSVSFVVTGQAPSPTPTPTPDPDPTDTPDDDVDDSRDEAPAAEPEVQAAAFTG